MGKKVNVQQGEAHYGSFEMKSDENETKRAQRLRLWYYQMVLINFVEFSAESARGVVLATLFLYSKSIGGNVAFMGLLTSLFSVGRLISSTVFGWLCDVSSFRTVYILSSVICLIGNFCYLLADAHTTGSLILLAFSRFVVGFGAGNRSVCRANVAHITTVHQRLTYLTILATVVFLGYALTPGLGSLVAEVDTHVLGIHLNKFTCPGVILIAFNLITILLVFTIYDESVTVHDAPQEAISEEEAENPLNNPTSLPDKLVNVGVVVFIFLNFNARGILSIFETVNIPLFLQATGSDPDSTASVVNASNFQFYLGLAGLVTYFSIELFRHKISDVTWVIMGFSFLGIGNLALSFYPSDLSFFRLGFGELFVWSMGCPITTAVVVAAFSKILGGRPQGTLMGLLGSAASVSRIVLPLLPGAVPSLSIVFVIGIILCVFSIIMLLWYNRVVKKAKEELQEDVEACLLTSTSKMVSPRSPLYSDSQENF